MADRGRPAKPKHLKVLHGDQKDRINDDEPVPAEAEIAPPYPLNQKVQAVWDRLAPDRIAQGVLTAWDVDAFAQFCEALVIAQSTVRSARTKAKPGAPSPLAEFQKAVQICSTLGGRFGWTPSDRAKLTAPGANDGPAAARLLS